jgi:hypothetical protein
VSQITPAAVYPAILVLAYKRESAWSVVMKTACSAQIIMSIVSSVNLDSRQSMVPAYLVRPTASPAILKELVNATSLGAWLDIRESESILVDSVSKDLL